MADYHLTTKKSWSATLNELEYVLEKWEASSIDVNYPRGARLEGFNQTLDDRRVVLRYMKNGTETVLTMDKQQRAVDNLRVLFLCIESMYMNERRGLGDVLQQAYAQLSAPVHKRDPYEVLGVFSDTPLEICEVVYKTRAKEWHPDSPTGNAEKFKELQEAIEQLREKGGK